MSLEEAVKYISDMIARAERHTPTEVTAFTPGSDMCIVAAVDGGSSVILDGGDFMVCAYRAGHIKYKNGESTAMNIPSPEVLVVTRENILGLFKSDILKRLTPRIDSPEIEFDRALTILREAKELNEILLLIEELPEGSIILFDGSFDFTKYISPDSLENIKSRLSSRNIALAGVSKTTSLRVNGLPFTLAFLGVKSELPWYSKIDTGLKFGASYAVKFHPVSRYVFRVDMYSTDIEHTLCTLAMYAQDPFYLGYPYPLAQVHNRISIPVGERDEILHRIARGLSPAQIGWFETMCSDFHEILDMGR